MDAPTTIRPYRDDDFDRWLEIANSGRQQQVTADEARVFEGGHDPDTLQIRLVAEEGAHAVGVGLLAYDFQLPERWYACRVTVAPERRGRGIGARLADALMSELPADAAGLGSSARDDDPAAQRFAERRGFERYAHMFLSQLTLDTFDPSAWRPRLDRLEGDGIELVDLNRQDDPDWRRLYALMREVMRDEPATGGSSQEDYDTFERILVRGFEHVAALVAVQGGRWLGTSITIQRTPGEGHTVVTGVRREARGRGLATALKVATIERARALGLARLGTDNDSRNAPMLAINRALGYVQQPGTYLYRRALP